MPDVAVEWALDDREPTVTEPQLAAMLEHALDNLGESGSWAFGIRFVGDAEMRALHEQFLDDPTSTDIMTFPYDAEDDERGGDIVISVDTAAENAAGHRWPLADELAFLVLHGLLHILGWDDRDDSDRRAMLDRQASLLAAWQSRT